MLYACFPLYVLSWYEYEFTVNLEVICFSECIIITKDRLPNYPPTWTTTNSFTAFAKYVCVSSRPISLLLETNMTYLKATFQIVYNTFLLSELNYISHSPIIFLICNHSRESSSKKCFKHSKQFRFLKIL